MTNSTGEALLEILLPFSLLAAAGFFLLRVMYRREHEARGGRIPAHLRPTRWMAERPWIAAAIYAAVLGGLSLALSESIVHGLIVAAVVYVVIGVNWRFGLGRWVAKRTLRQYPDERRSPGHDRLSGQ